MEKFKKAIALVISVVMVLSFAACEKKTDNQQDTNTPGGDSQDTTDNSQNDSAPKGELIGSGAVKFDTGKEMSGTLNVWFYEDGKRFIEPLFEDYKKYRPNVELNITYIAWNDYWTKLPVALGSGTGPDLYYFHNAYHSLLVNEKMQDPYPQELVDGLKQDIDNMEQYGYDGNYYYAPVGVGHGLIFYNKDLWAAAGLTDADIPQTWEQTRELAKQLTQKDGDKLVVSGFNLYPVGAFYEDMSLLSGTFEFSEDGTQSMINQPDVKKTYEFFTDWFLKDGICSPSFAEAQQSFSDGTSAMIWCHPYFSGVLRANAPDINYGVFPIPKFEEKARNWHFSNPDVSMGINAKASGDAKALATDLLTLFFADDKYMEDWCYEQSLAPSKISLKDSEKLQSNPVIKTLMEDSDNACYVGGTAGTYATIIANSLLDPMIIGGQKWDDVIENAVAELNNYLATANYHPVERKWSHADELK